MANPLIKIILDTRKLKKDGNFPVKLRITFERKQKYFTTPHNLTEAEFKKVMYGERRTKDENYRKSKIEAYEDKATKIIEDISVFTWQSFEKKYYSNRTANETLNMAFEERINQYKEAGQIGTAVSYECAKVSLNKFAPDTLFTQVTPEWLTKYEKYMLKKGNSKTTIGIYLRPLRSLFNSAISNNSILPAIYPFRRNQYEKDKYEIPEGSNIKKALDMTDIESLFNFATEKGSPKDMAKDFWIFSYLTNGLNIKDLCLLQYRNVEGDMLKFVRAKTARQKKEKTIQAILQPEARAIIKKWGTNVKDKSNYIFPILTGNETPERQRQLIQQLTHVINDHMGTIAKELKITKPVTTYSARHSFSTVLKRSGASIELISEMLGHSNTETTKRYLDSFESETLKQTSKALTEFKTQKSVN